MPSIDQAHMAAALALARRALGRVAPNPAVGCVLVRDGRVCGRGWTQPGGRPHAETEALDRAGEAARGASAYVTLEPCSHHGRSPPCCEALISAGVRRCVVACEDPDPRVAGNGLRRLRAAGVEVELGLMAREAGELYEGYFLNRLSGRPLVTLKLATTLDGRIATGRGESRWITGEAARARVHLLRAQHDAVMVGSGTALADDPRLDTRLPGLHAWRPVRIVLDRRLRLPFEHDLAVRAGEQPTWLFTAQDGPAERRDRLQALGVEVLAVEAGEDGMLSLPAILRVLAERGVTSVLVEGGARLATALLSAALVDRLAWFHAPRILGDDARPALAALGVGRLRDAPSLRRLACEEMGDDLLETYSFGA